MFKAPKFLGINPAKFIWLWIIRLIQTKVEHRIVENGSGVDLVRGDVVITDDPGSVSLATDATGWTGVCSQSFALGKTGVTRNDGYALVHLVDSIAPEALVEGLPVYLSATPGSADMVDGGGGRIGILANATEYNGDNTSDDHNPFAYVCLGYECPPIASNP